MGKAAQRKRERREHGRTIDGHIPSPDSPGTVGTYDRNTNRVTMLRPANFWRQLPGRRVQCTLCYRQCQLRPGERGWCKVRHNDGGVLRLSDHGVIANVQPHVTHYFSWRQHARMLWLSGISCTSGCTFCTSTDMALHPERLPWGWGERAPGQIPDDREIPAGQIPGWAYHKGMLHPEGTIGLAQRWECSGVYLGANEPTVTWEWSYDVTRLAKAAGLYVSLDSNGFTSPAAIEALAPYVDMVYLGMKGHLDPDFYAKRMRAPGAEEHVRIAARTWQSAGVHLEISDIVPPLHWMDNATQEARARELYGWIAAELGPLTPVEQRGMVRPEHEYGDTFEPLLPRDANVTDTVRLVERWRRTLDIARDCGLRYVYSNDDRRVPCHHCGGLLLDRIGWVDFDLNVSPEGICAHCGGQTPVIGISRDQWEQIQREQRQSSLPLTTEQRAA